MTERILIVVHGYPPAATAGAEQRAARTASGLRRRGADVRVLAFGAHGPGPLSWADTTHDGVFVRRLTGDVTGRQDLFRASYMNDAVDAALRAMVAEWHPQIVHLFSGYLMSASVVSAASEVGIPVVVSLTDFWWFCHRINLLLPDGSGCTGPTPGGCARCWAERRRRWRVPGAIWPAAAAAFWRLMPRVARARRWLGIDATRKRAAALDASLRQVRACISPSQVLADFYVRQGVDASRMVVMRQGVDVRCCPLRVRTGQLRVGYLGQIKAHKGVDQLLEAWASLSGRRPRSLTLYGSAAGEPAYGERIGARVAGLKDAAWRGAFGASEVWDVLASLDVVVIPSRWRENSPNVILEAQAMGIPVVGSKLRSIAELVEHGRNGLLFERDSTADLARQLQRLLDEPGLVRQLSRGALPLRTLDDELEDLSALYRRVLAEG